MPATARLTYQYTNFGVPGLGLKRGLGQNTVIAPYATMLAAQFMPREAVAQSRPAARDRRARPLRLSTTPSISRRSACRKAPTTPSSTTTWRTTQGMSIAAVANAIFEGRLRDRFHSDPVIEAAELLLQEKAPRDIPIATVRHRGRRARPRSRPRSQSPDTRIILDPLQALRATSVMSNGRYSVMVTATGSGYSRWGDLAVTRWQPDPTEDRLGSYIFLRDADTRRLVVGDRRAEAARRRERSRRCSADDKASFVKTVGTLRSEVECIVVSEGNGEGRRVTLYNDGATDRHIEVTSFAELVLAPRSLRQRPSGLLENVRRDRDRADNGAIFATRRKREHERAGHRRWRISSPIRPASARDTEAETDRRAFIGRGRTIADAGGLRSAAPSLAGTHGFTLDPVAALRRQVRVPANKKVSLTFWTVVGANRAELEEAIARLDHPESFARQAMLAWTRSQVQTRHLGLSLADAANVQKLARYLIYPDPFLRAAGRSHRRRASASSRRCGRPAFPAISRSSRVRIGDVADLEIVAQALRFQEYMRARGMMADFVIVNEQASSYVQDLQQAIETLCENSRLRGKRTRAAPAHLRGAPRPDGRGDLQDAAGGRPRRAAHPQRHHLRPDRARRGGSLAGARRACSRQAPATLREPALPAPTRAACHVAPTPRPTAAG